MRLEPALGVASLERNYLREKSPVIENSEFVSPTKYGK